MKRAFDGNTNRILRAFSMGQPVNVVGGMARPGLHFATDFDQFQLVRVSGAEDAVQKARVVIERLSALKDCRVLEVKWGTERGKPLKQTPVQFLEASTKALAAALQRGGMVKIDAVAWLVERYVEFSCVYVFEGPKGVFNPAPPHLESLNADIKELKEQGLYFKMAKRIAALHRAQNQDDSIFYELFNSDLGVLYSILCDITTLGTLDHVNESKFRDELQSMLRRLGGVRLKGHQIAGAIKQLQGSAPLAGLARILKPIVEGGARHWLQVNGFLRSVYG